MLCKVLASEVKYIYAKNNSCLRLCRSLEQMRMISVCILGAAVFMNLYPNRFHCLGSIVSWILQLCSYWVISVNIEKNMKLILKILEKKDSLELELSAVFLIREDQELNFDSTS